MIREPIPVYMIHLELCTYNQIKKIDKLRKWLSMWNIFYVLDSECIDYWFYDGLLFCKKFHQSSTSKKVSAGSISSMYFGDKNKCRKKLFSTLIAN